MYEIKAVFRSDGSIKKDTWADLWNEPNGNHDVDRVVFHPMYDHNRFHYDIAVLHLATAETTATPIKLPSADRKLPPIMEIHTFKLHVLNIEKYPLPLDTTCFPHFLFSVFSFKLYRREGN